jgi:hypothetical protein
MMKWYDREGKEIPMGVWELFIADPNYSFVACTVVGSNLVYTDWTGMEPAMFTIFYPESHPFHLVYETRVVDRHMKPVYVGDSPDGRELYATAGGAVMGHNKIVAVLASMMQPGDEARFAKDFADAVRLAREWGEASA